jgi:hypothetical protein
MKKYTAIGFFAVLLALLFVASCKPDEPVDPNEEELITKVQLTFTDSANGSNVLTALYSDPDGAGGAAATRFDSIRLDSGKVYNVSIALYDESDPLNVDNITTEVQAEAAEHLFCYTATGANITVTRTDSDGTFPIGITTKWRAGNPSTGTMRVELRHQPDGQKDGTCAPGATDVQLDFVAIVN